MPTMIMNQARTIRISIADDNTDSTFSINKQQIKSIDNMGKGIVRIDLGASILSPVLITASDVSNPQTFLDDKQLRDFLIEIWKSDADPTAAAPATEDEQMVQTLQLQGMNQTLQEIKSVLQQNNPTTIFSQPLITDTSLAGTTYSGYCVPGTPVNAQGWAIKKTVVFGGNTTITWAGTSLNLTQIWNNRTSLSYGAVSGQ